MAQRNSPSRRIPGEPLAGILRTVAYQARYSNRRRGDTPTVTNAAAEAAAEAAAVAAASAQADVPVPQPATPVAAAPARPCNDAATLQTDGDGRAAWQYEDRGTVPHVLATTIADQPAVATVTHRTATAATLCVWDLSGQPVAGAFVSVAALWP